MADTNEKPNEGSGGTPERISIEVDGKPVEKTIDELKSLATKALSTGDKTYTIKVDGEEKSMTVDELLARASEATGAQKKFDEAYKMSKKASKGMQILQLLEDTKGENPDPEKATELLQLLGVEDKAIREVLSGMNSNEKENKNENKSAQNQNNQAARKVTLDDMDPRVKAAVEAAEKQDLQQIRENIERECKKSIDNDKVLGKMIDELPDDSKEKVKEVLYGMVYDDVRSEILGRKPYGTEMLLGSLQKVRARVQNLGIPTRSTGQAPVMGELGISGAIAPEVRASEPIRRVKSSDPGYEENTIKRVQQMLFRAMRKPR